jgi:AcrR family transcriptional regulator
MAQRRARILDEARQLLVRGGVEGLNLRTLALAAKVTVPTIYNLVGNKEALVVELFSLALLEIESRVSARAGAAPLELAAAVVTESVGLFTEDEDYYRAAFIAVEHLNQSPEHHATVARLYQWGERLAAAGCLACQRAGYLRGRLDAGALGQHIVRSYLTNCRAWAFRHLNVQAFHDQALADVYITLAADAVETFHARLIKQISRLTRTRLSDEPT